MQVVGAQDNLRTDPVHFLGIGTSEDPIYFKEEGFGRLVEPRRLKLWRSREPLPGQNAELRAHVSCPPCLKRFIRLFIKLLQSRSIQT